MITIAMLDYIMANLPQEMRVDLRDAALESSANLGRSLQELALSNAGQPTPADVVQSMLRTHGDGLETIWRLNGRLPLHELAQSHTMALFSRLSKPHETTLVRHHLRIDGGLELELGA